MDEVLTPPSSADVPEWEPRDSKEPGASGAHEDRSALLVVDDRADKRAAMEAVLAELDYPMVFAESGIEALRHLLREDFSVILMDMNMPEMDGLELARMIRARKRSAKTPIIFYTADDMTAKQKLSAAYRLGAVDLLVAPVPAEVLRAKVAVFADFHRRLSDTRRKAGERERLLRAEAARAEAERASEAKDQFLAMLSHELRTPLSPVLNTIEFLLETPNHPPGVRHDLEMIRRNVVLEARLIDDLLDLTKVSRGKVSLSLEPVDVLDSIQNVLQICRPEIAQKQIAVTVIPTSGQVFVRADSARLKQILWNLVRNAVKFTERNGTIGISVAETAADRLRIDVADDGCGIPQELLPKIFDAFRQGKHTTGGLGLGLAITRSLVELHGGSIQVDSEGVGQGAKFSIFLPMGNLAAQAPSPETLEQSASPARAQRLTGRLLLVEDHPDTRQTLERLLWRRGYTVETAESVATAVSAVQNGSFDVILSDVGLPDGSGYDLMAQISKEQRAKAIALSGFGMEEDIAQSMRSGFSKHLIKPVNTAELDEAIQLLLRTNHSRPQTEGG